MRLTAIHPVPILFGYLLEAFPNGDPRVIYEYLHRPQTALDCADHLRNFRGIRDVRPDKNSPPASPGHQGQGFPGFLLTGEVIEGDVDPGLRKHPRYSSPDAPACSGYERHLTTQIVHVCLF